MPRIKTNNDIPDIQQTTNGFPKKPIQKVGIKGVQVPLKVLRKDGSVNQSSAEVSIYTNLTEKVKGANMSRYRIVVEEFLIDKNLNMREFIRKLLKETRKSLGASNAYVKVKFDYFMIKKAPVSTLKSYINYKCTVEAKQHEINNNKQSFHEDYYLTVQVPYTSLCPCSKHVSDYGAHNQRSFAEVKVKIKPNAMCWIEDIVHIVEKCASAPIINGLKRVDEAYQTEHMYENPRFVEDMVRLIAEKIDKKMLDKNISDYTVVVNHEESIHLHNAVAIITAGRELQ